MFYDPRRLSASKPPNPLQKYIDGEALRFTLSCVAVDPPVGGLTGLMEAPHRLNWFKVELSYSDSDHRIRHCQFIQWESKVHLAPPSLYRVLFQLLDDLNTYMHHPTLESFMDAGFINQRQAEAIYRVTVERGLMVADLLGPDLQAFVNAFADWVNLFPAAVTHE